MKYATFFQSPNVKKWGLAGCLLVALGANLSFNPDSKVIARNDGLPSGEFAFASTTGEVDKDKSAENKKESADESKSNKNVDEIELKDQYKGLKVKVQYTNSKDKARFIIEKSEKDETQAGVCITCVEKLGPETVTINELDRENIDLTRRAILAAAVKQLDNMKPSKTTKEEKKEKLKKDDSSIAARFDLDKYRCEKPEEMEDQGELADYKECLADNLKEMRADCRAEVQTKYEKEKNAAPEDKKYTVKRDTVSCDRLTKSFYNEEIKPVVRTAKRTQLNKALNTYNTEYQNAFDYSINAGSSPEKADEFAKTRARLLVSTAFINDIAFDINGTKSGSLAALHNQLSVSTNNPQYYQNFKNEYASPLMNVYRTLSGGSRNTQGGYQTLDITQLLQNAMNMDDVTLPYIPGQPPRPDQQGRQGGGNGGIQIFPGRNPIGGGIPRSGNYGNTQQQQNGQAWQQQRQQYQQQPQQQQYYPQSQQLSPRQGGLPGPRMGL